MKKPKFQIKIDRNNRVKIYLNKKWQKDIVKCDFSADLNACEVILEKYNRDSNGQYIIVFDELMMKKETYLIYRKKVEE